MEDPGQLPNCLEDANFPTTHVVGLGLPRRSHDIIWGKHWQKTLRLWTMQKLLLVYY